MNKDDALFAYVLRLGDNALVLAQRLIELVTHGPELEEEMANANFSLDFLGQARMFYSLAGELEGKGRKEDDFAFMRDERAFCNFLLVEQPNGNFADTITRSVLFEEFYLAQLEAIAGCNEARLAEIAARAIKEIRYHRRHNATWLIRLGDGTGESHAKAQAAVDRLWRYTGEMFAADEVDSWAADAGVGPRLAELQADWSEIVTSTLKQATLQVPTDSWMADGGKQGRHTEHLGYLLARKLHSSEFPAVSGR